MSTKEGEEKILPVFDLFNGKLENTNALTSNAMSAKVKSVNALSANSPKSTKDKIFSAHFKGSESKSFDEFYRVAAEQFKFPNYFSPNLDSFDEVMHDLSWIKEMEKQLIISDYDLLLTLESEASVIIILDILNSWMYDQSNHVFIEDSAKIRHDLQLAGYISRLI